MHHIETKIISVTSPEYHEVWQLREDVLRQPLGLSLEDEDLSGEINEIIIAAIENNTVTGCVIIKPQHNKIAKLRQMAVKSGCQNRGVGKALVTAAESFVSKNGFESIVLHARKTAVPFYEKAGYTITSEEFEEVGIPHVVMEKTNL